MKGDKTAKKAEVQLQLSRKRKHIVVTENVYDEDGFGDTGRRGIIPIEDGRDPDEMLEKAKAREWHLGDEADLNGFYKVTKGAALEVAEEDEIEKEA